MKNFIKAVMQGYENCFDEYGYIKLLPFLLLGFSGIIMMLGFVVVTDGRGLLAIPFITVLYLYLKGKTKC